MTDIALSGTVSSVTPAAAPWRQPLAEAGALIRLAIPIALIVLVNMGMSVTDTVMVAVSFGADGLAAVALGSDLYSILFYLGAGVIAGITPLYTAAATRADADERIRLELLGLIVVALCGTMLGPALWTAPDWLGELGLDPALLEEARGYARAMSLTLVAMLAVTLYRTILTAAERPTVFLTVTLAMLPLNAVGNHLLMHGLGPIPEFGPTGSGLSSLLVACSSFCILVFVSRRAAPEGRRCGRIDARDVAAVLRVGVPIGVATVAEVGVFLGATIYAASLGSQDVAAHTLTLRVAGISYALPTALLQAAMVRSARAEALEDRSARRSVARAALVLSLICGTIVAGVLLFASTPLAVGIFGNGLSSGETARLAASLILLLAAMEFLVNPGAAASGLLRGRRDTRVTMIASVFGYWVIGAPLGLWLSEFQGHGITGIWTGLAVGTVAANILVFARLRAMQRLAP